MSQRALPEHPDFLWTNPVPKSSYDVVIVGGGGHGLATAYYLARNHGIRNVAVLDRGWLAGGNMARNTTVIRSNYLWDESAAVYEHSLKLWESLEEELGYNMFFSRRGCSTSRTPCRTSATRSGGWRPTGSTAWTPSGSTRSRSRSSARSSTSATASGTRCWAPPTSRGEGSPSTTGSRGATPAGRTSWASTSSRTVRSPASSWTAAGSPRSRRRGAGSTPGRWHCAPHPLNAAFGLDRFVTGALIDEHGAAAVAH